MSDKNYWHRRESRIDEILESWRTAASFAEMALKSAILVNGASAVAMLAFIANQSVDTTEDKDIVNLVPALRHFLVGVFSAVLATAMAYFSAYLENRALWRWVENKKHGRMFDNGVLVLTLLAVIFIGYSYVRFWIGVESGINAMIK